MSDFVQLAAVNYRWVEVLWYRHLGALVEEEEGVQDDVEGVNTATNNKQSKLVVFFKSYFSQMQRKISI